MTTIQFVDCIGAGVVAFLFLFIVLYRLKLRKEKGLTKVTMTSPNSCTTYRVSVTSILASGAGGL